MRKRVLAILLAFVMAAPTMGTSLPVYATETDASAEEQNTTPEGHTGNGDATGGETGETGATGETGESGQVETPEGTGEPGATGETGTTGETGGTEQVETPEGTEETKETDETEPKDQTSEAKATTFTEEELEAVAARPDADDLDNITVTPDGDPEELSDIEQVLRLNNDQDPSMYIATNSLSHVLSEDDPDKVASYDDSKDIVSNLRYDHLTTAEQPVYKALKKQILEVANGERSLTDFALTTGDLTQDEFAAIYAIYSSCISTGKYKPWFRLRDDLFNGLFYDLSQEFFWSNNYYACWMDRQKDPDNEGEYIYTFHFRLSVAREFRVNEENPSENPQDITYLYVCDTDKVKAARPVIDDAAAIAHEADGMTLYEALCYFKERVNALVVYDHAAAEQIGTGVDYAMGPWNMISALDADPDTNIVCEGYSKAYKYLFDLWKANNEDAAGSGTYCYIVSGYAGGGHMWNIVHTESTNDDGAATYANYVIDLTNSDEEPTGEQMSQIFLQAPSEYKVFSENPDDDYYRGSIYKGRTSRYKVDRMNYVWIGMSGNEYEYLAMDQYSEKEIGITDKGFPIPDESTGNRYDSNGISTQNEEEEEVATATRYEHLTDLQKVVYDSVFQQVQQVAQGNRSRTQFVLYAGIGEEYDLTPDQYEALQEMNEKDTLDTFTSTVYEAMDYDHPFEFYWHNNYSQIGELDDDARTYTLWITVSNDYRADTEWPSYEFNTALAAEALEAQAAANAIAAEADGMTLYEALVYFHDRIDALVTYDYPAGNNPDQQPTRRAWYMVNPFDPDPDTNIVCECYSRSFKYLFDAWKARNPEAAGTDSYCYYVGGTSQGAGEAKAGPHAWNILHTSDGNYLIDLTACDETLGDGYASVDPLDEQPFLNQLHWVDLRAEGSKYSGRVVSFQYVSDSNQTRYRYYALDDAGKISRYFEPMEQYNAAELNMTTEDLLPAIKAR